MWLVVVVSVQPVGTHVTHPLQRLKKVAVPHLCAVGFIESFNIGILGGLASWMWCAVMHFSCAHSANAVGMSSGPLSRRIESGAPRTTTNSLKARMTRVANWRVSTSIRSPSGLNPSMKLKVLKRRPDHQASNMK